MYESRLQIRSAQAVIRQAPDALDTSILAGAMRIRVVEICDEANGICHGSPIKTT